MDRRQIFRTAWTIARDGAARFGGSAKQYFSAALRQAYKAARAAKALAAAGYKSIGAPDKTGKWTVWEGMSKRGANNCASILRRAGFVTFARKDAFGFLAA